MRSVRKKSIRFYPRAEAASVLDRVERQGANADETAGAILDEFPGADPRDRSLFFEIVMGTLRMRGPIDEAIVRASGRKISALTPLALQTIRTAVYQILYLDRIPPYAAVDRAVENIKREGLGKGTAGFVNAVLRRVAEGRSDNDRNAGLSHPEWIIEMFKSLLGVEGAAALCRTNNMEPPLTVRSIALRQDRVELMDILKSEGINSEPGLFAPQSLHLHGGGFSIRQSKSFIDGGWTVQDEAAQLVSLILDPKPGEKVMDACAAPGGKTAHIAELMGDNGEIIALDTDSSRLRKAVENLGRIKLQSVIFMRLDSAKPLPFPKNSFDKILVDAPCSALGTLRRSPEKKWRIKPSDISKLSVRQKSLLSNLVKYLKPGGVMVYSVCTVTPEECGNVVDEILSDQNSLVAETPALLNLPASMRDGRFIRTWPHLHGTDGFFIARLRKQEG